jgi:hypothetical protein
LAFFSLPFTHFDILKSEPIVFRNHVVGILVKFELDTMEKERSAPPACQYKVAVEIYGIQRPFLLFASANQIPNETIGKASHTDTDLRHVPFLSEEFKSESHNE